MAIVAALELESIPRNPRSLNFLCPSFDLTALAMIYWNLESKVAHLVFK